jgi:hypothetical protein
MIRYKGDPRWINAKFDSQCQCGKRIRRGERILYFPNGKTASCQTCGEPAYARFISEAQDEAIMNSQFHL